MAWVHMAASERQSFLLLMEHTLVAAGLFCLSLIINNFKSTETFIQTN